MHTFFKPAAHTEKPWLRRWEAALLLALCISLLGGLWISREQQRLARGLVRLHVIAASDSAEDQAKKRSVRDAVLETLTPALEDAQNPQAAQGTIASLLPELSRIGERISGQQARATLGWEHYPTRVYEGFALPAGNYLSLRLELGAAEGQNWWCVVFPPLCAAAVEDADALSLLLSEEEAALVTGDGTGYVLKFKLLELWDALRCALRG